MLTLPILKKYILFSSKFEGNSRTLELLIDGNFFYLSGRDNYYCFILNKFTSNIWKIRGIYSDRIYLGDYFNRSDINAIFGSYSHNFFLEVLFQFGLWGIPLIIICCLCVVRSTQRVKETGDISLKIIYSISASYCIGQLLFSNSYLTAMSFGIFAGVIICVLCKEGWIFTDE